MVSRWEGSGSWTRIPDMSGSLLSTWTSRITSFVPARSGRETPTEPIWTCSHARCFIRTYSSDAGSFPTITVASRGENPDSSICSFKISSRFSWTFLPSRIISFRIKREALCHLMHFCPYFFDCCFVFDVFEHSGYIMSDPPHLLLSHPAGGDSGGSDAETAGDERAPALIWNGIFIDGNMGFSERHLCFEPGKAEIGQIEEDEVIIGAAGDKAKALFGKNRCHCLGVLHDLAVVFTERGPERLFEADCPRSNGVHQRTPLPAREDCLVDLWAILCVAHERSASRSAKRLMGGPGGIVNDSNR